MKKIVLFFFALLAISITNVTIGNPTDKMGTVLSIDSDKNNGTLIDNTTGEIKEFINPSRASVIVGEKVIYITITTPTTNPVRSAAGGGTIEKTVVKGPVRSAAGGGTIE